MITWVVIVPIALSNRTAPNNMKLFTTEWGLYPLSARIMGGMVSLLLRFSNMGP